MADPVQIGEIFPAVQEGEPAAMLAVATAADVDREARDFTPLERFSVWNKAREAHPLNCAYWRLDESGNLIAWGDYGDAQSPHGWVIDHVVPLGHGGSNAIDNLQAVHVGQLPFSGGFLDSAAAGRWEA